MACRQKPEPPGKRSRGRPKKCLDKQPTTKTAKTKETKAQSAMREVRREGTRVSEDKSEVSVAAKKRTRKILSKKERESLVQHLSEVDPMVLTAVTNSRLREQSYFSEMLMNLVDCLCNSCIMYPSDFPDMYTQARGPLGPRAWVYISGKSRGHVIQLICTM